MASNTAGRALFRSLSKGASPAPVILLYGEEVFLIEEAVKAIKRAVLADGADEFSYQVLNASEVTGQQVRQVLENLPLFGGDRLIHLRGIDQMNPSEQDALTDYVSKPAPATTLLMTGRSVDLRKKFFKAVKSSKKAKLIAFKPLYDNELVDWVRRRARQKGLAERMPGKLAELVVALSGPELSSMDSALDKLGLYTGGGRLDEDTVRAVLDDTRTRNVFELTKLLAQRDLVGSINSLHRLLDAGDSAVGIAAMVARHFRIVWRVQRAIADGVRGNDLARVAGCPPIFAREYASDARRFEADRLAEIVGAIHDAERSLKSSPLSDRIVMGELVMQVTLNQTIW